jgi:hypothetical protein
MFSANQENQGSPLSLPEEDVSHNPVNIAFRVGKTTQSNVGQILEEDSYWQCVVQSEVNPCFAFAETQNVPTKDSGIPRSYLGESIGLPT